MGSKREAQKWTLRQDDWDATLVPFDTVGQKGDECAKTKSEFRAVILAGNAEELDLADQMIQQL